MRPREPWRSDIDLLRVIAAVMVVTIHATSDTIVAGEKAGPGIAYWLALIANEAARCAVPVFFALTGWLLLRRPIPDDAGWLGSRVLRLGVPLLAWSAIYLVEEVVRGAITDRPAWTSATGQSAWIGERLTELLAGPGVRTHLWYLYFAIAITILLWLLQATRLPSRDNRAYGLAALALVVPVGIATGFGAGASWNGAIWAVGYTALGYAVLESRPRRLLAAVLYAGGSLLLVVLTAVIGYDRWPSHYAGPLVAAATVGVLWLVVGIRVPGRWVAPLRMLSSLSLGIYLVHPLLLDVMRVATLPDGILGGMSPLPRLALLWGFGVAGSAVVAYLWHRSRRLAFLLG